MAGQPQENPADLPELGLQLRNKTPKRKVKAKPGAMDGQRLHRAPLALPEVRVRLPPCL